MGRNRAYRVKVQEQSGWGVEEARELHVPGAQVPKPPRRTARAATRCFGRGGSSYGKRGLHTDYIQITYEYISYIHINIAFKLYVAYVAYIFMCAR